ncbi:MAG: hypothetical protein RMY62_025330 [Nostoc sp. ZfuVER08]|uniref:hypothetical protein n=1 Tax=Nostoc punctiforme TaxID=272131 RepID=UPI0028C4FF81|nr:hypothetical protein [Nostoc punctiforme]MDZ8011111.1 hypothetical protein [Nostoc sp. ZfuVER08]
MKVNDLPLLELFTKLREAGLPLGIEEYQLVLQAMQAGFGINDQAALKRLCQTLWVKSSQEKQLFEDYFELIIANDPALPTAETFHTQSEKYKISPIIRYLILGIVGVTIGLGAGFFLQKSNEKLNPIQTSELIQTLIPSQTSKLIQTLIPIQPSSQDPILLPTTKPTTNPTPQPTHTPKLNSNPSPNPNHLDWLFWSFLLVTALIFKWLARRNAKQRISESTSHPQVTPSTADSSLATKLTKTIEDEVQAVKAVLEATSRNEEILASRLILTSEYLPVSERQMKQNWRYLRQPVREGPKIELDLAATINQIGCQGLLLEPVFIPRRVNKSELLLLIDQDGSMVPFHSLSRRLAETALRGGRLGKSGIYYFHNCPIEYLYHDPHHLQAELISNIVTRICSNRTAVLIFSDAGAVRGRYNEERYELTQQFLTQMKQRVRYIAWLNPMPKKRWLGTTAGEIAHLVPMFEVSHQGLQDAIAMLRGRFANFERQII